MVYLSDALPLPERAVLGEDRHQIVCVVKYSQVNLDISVYGHSDRERNLKDEYELTLHDGGRLRCVI